jgi:uncharacterized protein YodC (DUF2158 family)
MRQCTSTDNRAVQEDSDIQSGAQVVLRSGGPDMTVQTRSQNLAYCNWVEDGVLHHGTFTVDSLQVVSLAAGDALLRRTPMSAQAPVAALILPADGEPPATPPTGDPAEAD